jgi:hypothetical protein
MMELHAADLRFTLEEAAAFLTDVMGLNLSAGDFVTDVVILDRQWFFRRKYVAVLNPIRVYFVCP